MFSVPLLQNDGKAGPKCSSVLLGKSFPNDPGSEAEEKEGVGIGSLYGDTLMRSFQGNTSNHQPHIKLSSLPIASQAASVGIFRFRRGWFQPPQSVVLL